MFDRLKNLFRRLAEDDSATEPAPSTFPPREFQPGYSPADPASAPPQPAPAPHAAPSRPSDADALETAHPATGDSIKILLKPVLLKLPDALKARVRQPPAGPIQLSIPLQKVLAQLPQGSVKISSLQSNLGNLFQGHRLGDVALCPATDRTDGMNCPLQVACLS